MPEAWLSDGCSMPAGILVLRFIPSVHTHAHTHTHTYTHTHTHTEHVNTPYTDIRTASTLTTVASLRVHQHFERGLVPAGRKQYIILSDVEQTHQRTRTHTHTRARAHAHTRRAAATLTPASSPACPGTPSSPPPMRPDLASSGPPAAGPSPAAQRQSSAATVQNGHADHGS